MKLCGVCDCLTENWIYLYKVHKKVQTTRFKHTEHGTFQYRPLKPETDSQRKYCYCHWYEFQVISLANLILVCFSNSVKRNHDKTGLQSQIFTLRLSFSQNNERFWFFFSSFFTGQMLLGQMLQWQLSPVLYLISKFMCRNTLKFVKFWWRLLLLFWQKKAKRRPASTLPRRGLYQCLMPDSACRCRNSNQFLAKFWPISKKRTFFQLKNWPSSS